MYAGHIVGLTIFFLIKIGAGFNLYNNACKDYKDYMVRFSSPHCYHNPDVLSDTPTIIVRNGYPLESHSLTTEDGYILTLFRIPSNNNRTSKPPVFLMHGIVMNNSVWVFLGNRSLAFKLADKGYDVWLGTVRGNDFSKKHTRYKISDKEYWNFNLDTVAYFDVGAQLKFIAGITKRPIIYIGYSMGTTVSFLYTAGYPSEVKNLLSGIIALAPVVYFSDSKLADRFEEILDPLEREVDRLSINSLFYQSHVHEEMVQFCAHAPHICKTFMDLFSGNVTDQFRPVDLLLFFSQCPSGVSIQVLKHYIQLIESGHVSRYDYGKLKNLEYYHLTEPRKYDLRYIKTPVYLFYGQNDAIVSKRDVETLFQQLGSYRKKLVSVPRLNNVTKFTHLDMVMSKDIEQLLYPDLFEVLEELTSRRRRF